MDLKIERKYIKDFIKMKDIKSSLKPLQKKGKELLSLSDEELEAWLKSHNTESFIAYVLNYSSQKADRAKYNRLKRKAEEMQWDGDLEFTESEEEFILSYEEENNIKQEDSILN